VTRTLNLASAFDMASTHPIADRMRADSFVSELDIGPPSIYSDRPTQKQPNFSRRYPHKLTETERRLAEQVTREPHNCHPLRFQPSALNDGNVARASTLRSVTRRSPNTDGADSRPSILDPAVFEPLERSQSHHTGYEVAVDHTSFWQRETSPSAHFRRDSKQTNTEEDVRSTVAGGSPNKTSSEAERNALRQLVAARLSPSVASSSSSKREQTPLNDIPSGTATDASSAEQGETLSSSERLHSQYNGGLNGTAAAEYMQATDTPHPSIFSSHGVHGSTLVDDHVEIAPIDNIGAALKKSASEHLADIQLQMEADQIIATEMAAAHTTNPTNRTRTSGPTTPYKYDDPHRAEDLQQIVDVLSSAAGSSGFRKKRKMTHMNGDARSGGHSNPHDAGPIRTPKGRWRRSFNVVVTRPVRTGHKANARRLNGFNILKTEAGHESAQPKVDTYLPQNTTPTNEALKLDLEHSERLPNTQAKGAFAAWYV